MQDNVTGPVAGWYPQDGGLLRYWDGHQWTDQWATPSSPTPSAPPPPPETSRPLPPAPSPRLTATEDPPSQPPRQPRKWKTPVLALALGFIVAAVVFGAAVLLTSRGTTTSQSGASPQSGDAPSQQESSQAFDSVPTSARQVDLSVLGDNNRLRPILKADRSQVRTDAEGNPQVISFDGYVG